MVSNFLPMIDNRGTSRNNRLEDFFFNVDTLRQRSGIDMLVRGLLSNPSENVDNNFADAVIETK